MTEAKERIALEKLGKNVPKEKYGALVVKLKASDDKHFEALMALPLKSKIATILFAIFLGSIGVDRFYIGDTGTGVAKIVGTLIPILLKVIFGTGIIIGLLNTVNIIWKFVDIFISYKAGLEYNYDAISNILNEKV